ncbi:substrate-binding domain-containing protein, partial [Patulibacter sp. S7RM1-6]
ALLREVRIELAAIGAVIVAITDVEDQLVEGFARAIVAAEAVGLTTVRSPQQELARRAATALVDAIEEERPAEGALLVPELVVRDT